MTVEKRNEPIVQSTGRNETLNGESIDTSDPTHANRDPISGAPGAHPLGTGVGAAGVGTVATVVGGVVAGPVGAVVGAVVGSVAGGLAGKGAAEHMNPTVEDNYWRENYATHAYVEPGKAYEEYQPAYRTGYEGYAQYSHTDRDYSEIETDLQRDYEAKQNGGLPWDKAKPAVKDAWDRAALSKPH